MEEKKNYVNDTTKSKTHGSRADLLAQNIPDTKTKTKQRETEKTHDSAIALE